MKTLFKIITIVGAATFATGAGAATINDGGLFDNTDVGFVDRFVVEGLMDGNSSTATETAWVNEQIALDQGFPSNKEYILKTEDVGYYSTDVTNVFAFELTSDPAPGYFLIKNAQGIALFQNTIQLNWGVFDAYMFATERVCGPGNSGCDIDQIINLGDGYDFTISHVTEFTGTDRNIVPIPPAVWLFGSGLIGLVGVARRKDPAA